MPDYRARLYLVTPPLRKPSDILSGLAEALGAGDVACLLVRLQDLSERDAKHLVRELAPIVQGHGTALLLEDARLAARAGADGVHVSGQNELLASAIESLKPERIVGVGGLTSRDAAMRAGESGADYLMFGEPEAGHAPASAQHTLDRVEWWAEIFNVPCVGYAGALDEVAALVLAGADFVALGDAVWQHAGGPAAAVAEAEAMLLRARIAEAGEAV